MAKWFLHFLLLSTILFGCKEEKKEPVSIDYAEFSTKEVLLVGIIRDFDNPDTIGKVSIKIPARLDTFYQWHRSSDCTSCGRLQYRFADHRYKQFAEGGFFWTYVPDSVYQLTISHVPIREVPDSIIQISFSAKDTLICRRLAYQLGGQESIKPLKEEFKEINGRGFLITAFRTQYGKLTNDTTLYLLGMTRLKNRTLNFIAECGAKDTTGFIDNMYKTLLSIKIIEK